MIHKLFENPKNFLFKNLFKIYHGEIFLFLNAQEFSESLVFELENNLIQEFGRGFALSEFFISQEDHFQKLSLIRKKLYNSTNWIRLAKNFLLNLGFEHKLWMFDYPRIRAIVTEKNRSPLAEPAYYIHRDTWYGNSESQINFWIPLCDIYELNGFAFYLEYFNKPILNDSQMFNYSRWKVEGGYQSQSINKIFPKSLIPISQKETTVFECPRGAVLVFSGSHLHRTLPNWTYQTRFSLDLRIVNLRHHFWEIGAPNVDNLCKGNNLEDMFFL